MSETEPSVSLDAFFRGRFAALQPLEHGHRSGSDALLLAASLPHDSHGRMADLGAGAGVAAFAALSANPRLSATLVEQARPMAELAARSLELPINSAIRDRVRILVTDVTLRGQARRDAGLDDATFDHVLCNPPYHLPEERGSPDPLKVLAHRLPEGGLEAWMRTAGAILRPGGCLHLIWRTSRLAEALTACKGRFGDLALIPLHARSDQPALRVVMRGVKGSRAPLRICPGIVLHESDGSPTALASRLLNGEERLACQRSSPVHLTGTADPPS